MRRFFAHSISVARSPAGRNLNGAGRVFAIWRRASAFEGRIRPTRSGAKWRNWRSAAEWKVPARTRCTPSAASASAQLARGLVGEGDGHDPRRLERAGRDLLGDPAGDRRRLAGAGAREDADGAAHGLGRAPLLRVQAVERVHLATVPPRSARSVTEGQLRPARLRDGRLGPCLTSRRSCCHRLRGQTQGSASSGLARGRARRRTDREALRSRESTNSSPMCSTNRMRALGPPPYQARRPSTSRNAPARRSRRWPDSCSESQSLGASDEGGTNRVHDHVCAISRGRAASSFETDPRSAAPRTHLREDGFVEPDCVARLQLLHAAGEIGERRLHDQVEVVRHHAVRVQPPAEPIDCTRQSGR